MSLPRRSRTVMESTQRVPACLGRSGNGALPRSRRLRSDAMHKKARCLSSRPLSVNVRRDAHHRGINDLEGENGERRRCWSRGRMELGLLVSCRRPRSPASRRRARVWGWRARRRGRGSPIRSWSSRPSADRSLASTRRGSSPRRTRATRPGEVGELLRREGLYTSHLTYWRKQRKDGALQELGKPRGRKPVDRRDQEIAALTRKLERSEVELAKARQRDRDPGKRLSAAGRDARNRQREQEHRAMIAADR